MTLSLIIYEESDPSIFWQAWPTAEIPPSGTITENKNYIFELQSIEDPFAVELYVDGFMLEALRPADMHTARWKWSSGFNAGKVILGLEFTDRKPEYFEFIADPAVEKLTRDEFNLMIQEILEDTFALFALSGFKTGISKGTGQITPPLARMEFLKSRFEQIEKTIQAINDRPVSILREKSVTVPYYKIRTLNPRDLIRSMRAGPYISLKGQKYGLGGTGLTCFPLKIKQKIKNTGVDIQEHRNIKLCLTAWSTWLGIIGAKFEAEKTEDQELKFQKRIWANRCRVMASRLNNLLNLPLFQNVSISYTPVVLSPIYENIPVYRQFFRIYQDIQLGISNIFGDFIDISLARTFDLYEIWTFMRILRAAVIKFKLPEVDADSLFSAVDKKGDVKLARGSIAINLGNEIELAFKRKYKEYWIDKKNRGSFSRPMEPDIAIEEDKDGIVRKIIVLDAKYRIEYGLNDAVASIHMYRDALVRENSEEDMERLVSGAYILTPQIPGYGASWKKAAMPGRLFHPKYRGKFKFGAVTLRPGMELSEITAALENILNDAAELAV